MQQRNARTASSSTTEHTWSERAAAYVCSSYPELTKATRAPQKLTPPPPASKSGVSAGERCEVYGKGHYTCSTADIRAEQHSVQLIIITARDTNGSSADRRTQMEDIGQMVCTPEGRSSHARTPPPLPTSFYKSS